jgi:hypothetical protein
MYGVPEDLDLSLFHGLSVNFVLFGPAQVDFSFWPDGLISVQGRCQLLNGAGQVIDEWAEGETREVHRLHRLVGQEVVATRTGAPDWFTLHFANGLALRVLDDHPNYESVRIDPGNVVI